MSDCVFIGRCVGVRNYTKKDNTPACILSMADSQGQILEFLGNGTVPSYPFGTPLSVDFNIGMFNGKISRLNMESLKEVK